MAHTFKARKIKGLGQETANQIEHINKAGAKAVTEPVLVPGEVVTTDTSAAPVFVGRGNLLRIEVTADTYVAFGEDPSTSPIDVAVTAASTPAVKLPSGYHLVNATEDFIRTSAVLTRLEVITCS